MADRGPKYAPIRYEPVPYPLTGGVDSKFHGIALPPPKLQVCENAYVDQTGSIQRRFGRTALGTLDQAGASVVASSWLGLSSYQGRLLGYTSSKLYDYSEADSRWTDRGRANSYRIRSRQVDAPTPLALAIGAAMDMAVLGNYRCYAYDYYLGTNLPVTAFTLTDADGNVLAARQTLQTSAAASTSCVKVVAFGTRFYIVYVDTTTTANLKCFVIDTTSASTIATSLAGAAATTAANLAGLAFDVDTHAANGPFLAYRDTTIAPGRLTFGFITTAGALASSSTSVTAGLASFVSVATLGAATAHGIVYAAATTPNDVYALIRTFSAGSWSVTATSAAMDVALTAVVRQVQCVWESNGTTLRVFYTSTVTTRPGLFQGTYTTAGVLTRRTNTLVHSQLAARPFLNADLDVCAWVFGGQEGDAAQPTLYLMKYDGTLLGWANQGVASLPSFDLNLAIQHVVVLSGAYSFLSAYFASIALFDGIVAGDTSVVAMREVIVDFVHAQSHVAVEDGFCSYLPGGMLQQYDGVGCTESGFLRFVDTQNHVTLTPSNGAGLLTVNAPVAYHIVPEWTNAQGEREQGTDGGSKTVTLGAADDTVTILSDSIPWTLKKSPRTNISFAVYRTLANPTADSPFYRVGVFANDPANETVAFVDLMSDAVAATQEQFRFSTELDHIASPAGYILAAGNGRVLVAGLADDPFAAVYSKTRGHGEALAFNDALRIVVPPSTGPITAAAIQNDSIILFCERAIYRVNGSGTNNTGTAGSFTDPILVATNEGAVGPRGTVVTPGGIMFDSTTRGISLIPPSLAGAAYIGAPLEKLTDPGTCTGALVVPELQQVRFSFAAKTYVYDYFHSQWYVFTHGSTGPTATWNGAHVGIVADVAEYDDATVWTDAGTSYTMVLRLGFVTGPQAKRSDLAIRSIGLTGVSLAAHALSVYLRYDLGAVSETVIETSIAGAGVLEPRWRIGQQHCSSLEVTIRDALVDVYGADLPVTGAGMKLNELVFELGVKTPGLGRDV